MGNQQCMSLSSLVDGNFQASSQQTVQIIQKEAPIKEQKIEENSPTEESTNQTSESQHPSISIRGEKDFKGYNTIPEAVKIENDVEEEKVKEEQEQKQKIIEENLRIEQEQKAEEERKKKELEEQEQQLQLKNQELIKQESLRKQKEEAKKKQQEFQIKTTKAQQCSITDSIPLLNKSYYKGTCYELDKKKYPHGEGIYISSPTSKLNIRGEFKNGYLIKIIYLTFKDNSTYKGDLWVHDAIKQRKFKVSECENVDEFILPHGYGKQIDSKYQWSFQGKYDMGQKHGDFVYESNGVIQEGKFEKDKPVGQFKITENDVITYGPFKE